MKQETQTPRRVELSDSQLRVILAMECLKDENFKKEFLKDPKVALEKTFKVKIPEKFQITAVEETENSKCFVIPYVKNKKELQDEELLQIVGGSVYGDPLSAFKEVHNAIKGMGEKLTIELHKLFFK